MADKPSTTPAPAPTSVSGKDNFDRNALEALLRQRFFYTPAFSIYGGVRGLFDYGPPGCAVKNNLLAFWRQHFILEEAMLEIESTALTPEVVLKTSGHVEKFQDMMVKDTLTGECYRADHLLEETIDKWVETNKAKLTPAQIAEASADADGADALAPHELDMMLAKYGAVYPESGNPISKAFFFNLMFDTQIGPTGKFKGFLRPETAQGIFVNFKKLLEANSGRLPFAAAQVGPAFRNEISPRAGLLRVREFTLAEIEHFVDPSDKSHPKFKDVASTVMRLYPAKNQLGDKQIQNMAIGDAVAKGIVNNETLGYFLARINEFLLKVGINPNKLRFRQHLPKQMAHYASDCWDAEIQTSYGWIECVGCADRSAYDLTVHQGASGEKLTAWLEFKEGPRDVDIFVLDANKGAIGKTYRDEAKKVLTLLESIKEDYEKIASVKAQMDKNGHVVLEGIKLTPTELKFKSQKKRLVGKAVIPGVIEPSFGIGRIMYCILEHAYFLRAGTEKRSVLSFKPNMAPTKVSILPVSNNDKFTAFIPRIVKQLTAAGITSKPDESSTTLGRKYARADEVGTPFGITIYGDTLDKDLVTLRERDTTHQIVVPVNDLTALLSQLCNGIITWDEAKTKYPIYDGKVED